MASVKAVEDGNKIEELIKTIETLKDDNKKLRMNTKVSNDVNKIEELTKTIETLKEEN